MALDGTLASCYAESCFCPLLSPFLPLKEEGRLSIATSLIIERDWGRTKMKNAGGRFFESFFGAQSGREHRNERKMRVVKPGGGL